MWPGRGGSRHLQTSDGASKHSLVSRCLRKLPDHALQFVIGQVLRPPRWRQANLLHGHLDQLDVIMRQGRGHQLRRISRGRRQRGVLAAEVGKVFQDRGGVPLRAGSAARVSCARAHSGASGGGEGSGALAFSVVAICILALGVIRPQRRVAVRRGIVRPAAPLSVRLGRLRRQPLGGPPSRFQRLLVVRLHPLQAHHQPTRLVLADDGGSCSSSGCLRRGA
mmetsp:Transcript_110472/g.293460  ORF Transcript_110472/g.293460 Transcript_110472/m.293460 type:complete len:222 (-) Transcript_110472:92-757(-)